MTSNDTIAAVATARGGALTVIRVSGPRAIEVCDSLFVPVSGKPLNSCAGYTIHYGNIIDRGQDPCENGSNEAVVDDVLVSLFRAPKSYTGEDMVEISCHGSDYLRTEVMRLLIRSGARQATPGEFTVRAFLSGKMDLSQAEAVADIIAAENRAGHELAGRQLRGGYSARIAGLRKSLMEFAALLELELDFSEEEVEFADRTRLGELLSEIDSSVRNLLDSFSLGNAIKNGIPVVITGKPNVGKSTLLNALVCEDRAMVSDIEGTTRDVIEDMVNIDGIRLRISDTAGLRRTEDRLENMGIDRALEAVRTAAIILYMADITEEPSAVAARYLDWLSSFGDVSGKKILILLNKTDKLGAEKIQRYVDDLEKEFRECDPSSAKIYSKIDIIPVSAREQTNLETLRTALTSRIREDMSRAGDTVVSNIRHMEALSTARAGLERIAQGLETGLPTDLITEDVRDVLYHLGTVTGEITNDEILGAIFSKFCIGK